MAPPAAARAGWSGWPGRCTSPAEAREPPTGWRDRPRWPPARHRCVQRARPGPPRRAPQAARDGSPQPRPGPPRRSPPRAVRSLAPRPGPSTSPPGRMMSPRRTTLPELARFPPKVPQLRPSPRFGQARAAGPEPLGLLPDPLPPAQLRSAPSPRPARPAEALRRRLEWQSGPPDQPLPAADRPTAPLALPRAPLALLRAPPRQRAGPPWVQPPTMPAYRPRHPRLPGKIPPLPPARSRVPREPP
jgi:hypothetical protein